MQEDEELILEPCDETANWASPPKHGKRGAKTRKDGLGRGGERPGVGGNIAFVEPPEELILDPQ